MACLTVAEYMAQSQRNREAVVGSKEAAWDTCRNWASIIPERCRSYGIQALLDGSKEIPGPARGTWGPDDYRKLLRGVAVLARGVARWSALVDAAPGV